MTAQATPLSPSHPSMVGRHTTRNGNTNYDSLSLYAKAYARQSGLHLKVLGEAGFKYLSGAVENWRAGGIGADNDAAGLSPRGACAALNGYGHASVRAAHIIRLLLHHKPCW